MPSLNEVLKNNKKVLAVTSIDSLISSEAAKAYYNRSRGRKFKYSFAMYYLVINRLLKSNADCVDPILATKVANKLGNICGSSHITITAKVSSEGNIELGANNIVTLDGKPLTTLDNKALIIL